MAHSYLLLNTGDRLLLNDNSFLLLNAEGPSQVHLVGTHASQTIQRTRLKPVQTQVWIKAKIKRRVQIQLTKLEHLLNPKTFSNIPKLPVRKIKHQVERIVRRELNDIKTSVKLEIIKEKQELKRIEEEELMQDPIFHGMLLKEILKKVLKR